MVAAPQEHMRIALPRNAAKTLASCATKKTNIMHSASRNVNLELTLMTLHSTERRGTATFSEGIHPCQRPPWHRLLRLRQLQHLCQHQPRFLLQLATQESGRGVISLCVVRMSVSCVTRRTNITHNAGMRAKMAGVVRCFRLQPRHRPQTFPRPVPQLRPQQRLRACLQLRPQQRPQRRPQRRPQLRPQPHPQPRPQLCQRLHLLLCPRPCPHLHPL
mmetsp:Transcript_52991/g.105277  ORF Transcript_52991/g.105277 Transcript_52991/m.105277 type:complete len:217 (-) Transcript_52991:533-1183(-)